MSDLFCLTDKQMERLRAFFPKSHARPGVDDQRVPSGTMFANRSGRRWRDAPSDYGPHKTLHNRWKRWGEAGAIWKPDRLDRSIRCLIELAAGLSARKVTSAR